MKFMVNWRVHDDNRHQALKIFSAMSDDAAAKDVSVERTHIPTIKIRVIGEHLKKCGVPA